MQSVTIQPLRSSDLREAIALLEVSGLAGARDNLARYLRCQPGCGWAAVVEEQLVGVVTVLVQGTVGFVGAMAVHPARRGLGVGRALLERGHASARRAGVTTFLLEATPAGEPMYQRLGYVPEYETSILQHAGGAAAPAVRISAADHAAIARLDRMATGTVRDDLLAVLHAEGGPGEAIHRDGELIGAGLIVGERLGPVIASEPDVGLALLAHLAPACRVATVPVPNEAALAAFADLGYTCARRLRRMRLGPEVAVRPTWIWALASPGAG